MGAARGHSCCSTRGHSASLSPCPRNATVTFGPLKSFAVTHVLNVAGEIKPTHSEVLRLRRRVEAVVFVGTNHPAAWMHRPYRIHG